MANQLFCSIALLSSGPWTTAATVNTVSGTGAFSGTFTAPTAGSYYFQAYFAQAVSGNNLWQTSTSTQQTITVNAALSVSVSPGSSALDFGQSETFTAVASGGSGTFSSYQWYVGGVSQSGQTSSTFSFASGSVGPYLVTVTVTDSLGTKSAPSPAASVTVSALPTVSITPIGPLTMDAGQSQLFTASVTGGSGVIHYEWYAGAVLFGLDSSSCTYIASGSSALISCEVTDSASTPVVSPSSNAVLITVNTAQIAVVTPASVILDIGQSQLFTCSASGGTGTLSYQWYLGGLAVSGETGTTYTYTAGSAGSPAIYCMVTDSASTPYAVPSNTPAVTVATAPSISLQSSSANIDSGQSIILTSTVSGGVGPFTWLWYDVNGIIAGASGSGTTATCTVSAADTEIYVTFTDTGTSVTPDLTATSNAIAVTVYSVPSISTQPSSATIDSGQLATLTSIVSGGTGLFTWQWYNSDGAISGASGSGVTASHIFTAAATGIYVIFMDSGTGSATPTATATSSPVVSVIVNAAQIVAVAPTSVTLDIGQTQTFTCAASGGMGALSYQWYVGGLGVSGQTDTSYTYTAGSVGSPVIYCMVTDSAPTPYSVQSNTPSVTVSLSPTVSVAPIGPLTMDVGQTQLFTATPNGGSGVIHYQWYVGSTAVGTDASSYAYTASGSSASLTCIVTDSASTPITSPASNVVIVTVNAAAIVNVSPVSWTMEVGQSEMFTCAASGGSGALSYQWYVGGLVVSGQTGITYLYSPGSVGSPAIYCVVTDSASTPFAVQSNTPIVTVNSGLSISVSPGSWTMDIGQSKQFSASASGGSGTYSSYTWYVNGLAQIGETAQSFTYSPVSAGSYLVTVTVTDKLGVTSAQSSAASVAVAASPTVSLAPDGPLGMDLGQIQVFTATVTGGSGTIHYQWYLNAGIVGSDSSTYSYTASGSSAIVSCVATDSASSPVTSPTYAVSIMVNSNLVAPTVSASVGILDQDQTSTLTPSAISTGTGPYTYQWLSEAPGVSSFSTVSGATLSGYSFVTTGSTTVGVWNFELQVKDASLATVTSNIVSVTVNSALSLPSVSASQSAINLGQSSTLSITGASGGTIPYSYQWLEMAPGAGSYSPINGATSASYVFSTSSSTVTGSWSFEIKVTDSASSAATVTSAASVTVNSEPAWDFEDHTFTHSDMTTLTTDQITSEENIMNSLFARYGLQTPIALAYPSGAYNAAVINAISTYRSIGRTAGTGTFFPEPYPVTEWYNVSSANIGKDTSFATVQSWIDQDVQQKGLLNLFTHRISDPADQYGCTPAMLQQVLDYLLAQQNAGNLQVLTMRQSYSGFNGQKAVVTISFDDSWETDYSVVYPMFQAHGFAGTSFIIGDLTGVGDPTRLTWAQIDQMAQTTPPTWTVSISSSPSIGGSTSLSGTVNVNQYSLTVTAIPSAGYVFDGWSFDGTSSTFNPIVLDPQDSSVTHSLIAYFVPIASSTVFQDGFESGSFSPIWWPSDSSSTIVSAPVQSGSYAAQATGNSHWDHTLGSSYSDLFFSGYVQIPQLPPNDQTLYFLYINDASYAQTVRGGVYVNAAGGSNWLLSVAGVWSLSSIVANLKPNYWYFIEIEYNTNGPSRMWVDGNLVAVSNGQSLTNPANNIQVGNPFGGTPTGFVSYGDNYTVATQFIAGQLVQNTCPVTVNVGTHGSSNIASGTVNWGTTLNFVFTPDAGYIVSDVKVNGISVGALSTDSLTITGPTTVDVSFALKTFTMTVTQTANGQISPGTGSVNYGDTPTYTITPAAGYQIASITVNGQPVTVTNSAGQTYQFTAVTSDSSITATFAINSYLVTVNVGANGLSNLATQTVNWNTPLSFTFTPNTGYHVADVVVNGTTHLGSITSYNPTITGPTTVDVTFAQTTYTIMVTQTANGLISPDTTSYAQGSSPSETITPAIGYYIATISVDGSPVAVTTLSGQTISFNSISAAHTITATFAQIAWQISVTQSANGLISPDTASYTQGSSPGETVTPANGYYITSITVDGNPVTVTSSGGQTVNFINIQIAHTITATFAQSANAKPACLVVRGSDDQIYYRTLDPSSATWSSWIALPGLTLDSPAAAVCGSQLYIVVRGLDGNTLWFGYVNLNDGTFSGFSWISGSTPSAPTLVSNGTALTLVVRGSDNMVYYRVYTVQTQTWSAWQAIPSGTTCDKISAVIQDNELHVVMRGFSTTDVYANNTLWQSSVNLDSGAFSGWTPMAGSTPSAAAAVLVQATNSIVVIVRGDNNLIYTNTWDGSSWLGWTLVPIGDTTSTPAAAVVNNDLYFVVVGMNNALYYSSLNLTTNSFSGWTALDGSIQSAPILTE